MTRKDCIGKPYSESSYTYIGIAAHTEEDEEVSVIIFADDIKDKCAITMEEKILNEINVFRNGPYKRSMKVSTNTTNVGFKKELNSFRNDLSKVSMKSILGNDKYLNQLAEVLGDKLEAPENNTNITGSNSIKDLNSRQDLIKIALSSIHGFNEIYARVVYDKINANEIIDLLLANPDDKNQEGRKCIVSKNITSVGIYHDNHEGKSPRTIVIGVDMYYPGSERPIHEYFEDELLRFRKNPCSFIPDIKMYKHHMECKTYKKDIVKDINDFMNDLNINYTISIGKIQNSCQLNKACMEYLNYYTNSNTNNTNNNISNISNTNRNKLYPEDDDFLFIRLNHYISKYTICKEFISNKYVRPEEIITDFLISENDLDKKSRFSLLTNSFKFFGVSQKEIKGDIITCFILTDKASPIKREDFKADLLKEMNNIRTNPRSYIKHFDRLHDSIVGDINKKANEKRTILLNIKSIIESLGSLRSFTKLEHIQSLEDAANTRVLNFKEDNTILSDKEDLRVFLSDFGRDYTFYSQYAGYADFKDTNNTNINIDSDENPAASFLTQTILSDFTSNNFLDSILNVNFFVIGISYDKETNLVVLFIADDFLSHDNFTIEISDKWRRIKRPKFCIDEIEQMRHDFKKFDILNEGFIKPNNILVFLNNMPGFVAKNPMYYSALKKLNTIENNENGINVNMFMDAVQETVENYSDDDWKAGFALFLNANNSNSSEKSNTLKNRKHIDYDCFSKLAREVGYNLSDIELNEIWDRITNDQGKMDVEEFIRIMNLVEK